MREYTYDLFKSFNEDAKSSDQEFIDIKQGIDEVFERQRGVMRIRHGNVGGGEGHLELYGQEGGGCHSPLKKTKYSVKFAPTNKGGVERVGGENNFAIHWVILCSGN